MYEASLPSHDAAHERVSLRTKLDPIDRHARMVYPSLMNVQTTTESIIIDPRGLDLSPKYFVRLETCPRKLASQAGAGHP